MAVLGGLMFRNEFGQGLWAIAPGVQRLMFVTVIPKSGDR